MHEEVRSTLKNIIQRALTTLQSFSLQEWEIHLVWRKTGTDGWTGTYERRPSLFPIFYSGQVDWELLGRELTEALRKHHPEYLGMVGGSACGMLRLNPTWVLQAMVEHLWRKYSTFSLPEEAIDAIVQEFATFIDSPTIPLAYLAPLINFRMDEGIDQISLPADVTIRRLSEHEVSELHGGRIELLVGVPRRHDIGMCEFALVGGFDEPKLVGELLAAESAAFVKVQWALNRAIIALRTFKKGRVGYDAVHLRPQIFCPVPRGTKSFGSEYIPFGGYHLSAEEVQPFQEHARLLFANLDPSLEMACSRLADAEVRLQPRDQIVDAVIGLETILLAKLQREDRRGELRFRFSLHYSTFFDTPMDRYQAFRLARDLYDLRSSIVHGSPINEGDVTLGDEKLNLAQAAEKVCEILRATVKRFLLYGNNPPYKKANYWDKAYFGVTDV